MATSSAAVYCAGDLYGTVAYIRSVEHWYYYPVGAVPNGTVGQGYISEINAAEGYVKHKIENRYGAFGNFQLLLNTGGLAVGEYSAKETNKAEITTYDGTIITTTNPTARMAIKAIDPADVNNKLALGISNYNYSNISEDYSVSQNFTITNGYESIKTNQWIEAEIDENFQAREFIVRTDEHLGAAKEVYYKTNLSDTEIKADPTKIISTANYTGVTREELGLAEGEYITYARAYLGNYSKGYNYLTLGNSTHSKVIGKLKEGIMSAGIKVRTYSFEEDGKTVDTDSVTQVTSTCKKLTTAETVPAIAADSQALTMIAGETKTTKFKIGSANQHYYSDTPAIVAPKLYIRLPENVTIEKKTVTATSNFDGKLKVVVSDPYTTSSGETFVEISVPEGNAGVFFGANETPNIITIDVDITASQRAVGNYNWSEYAFIKAEGYSRYKAINSFPNAVADKMDVDNNKNTTEQLLPTQAKNFTITAKNELLVDTYITPSGEEKKPGYNPLNPETAVGFTPSSKAEYTVDILNNRLDMVNRVMTYVPVPKTGNNFGEFFQDNKFAWDMKLNGAPLLKVYDINGLDISNTHASNYKLSYSSDATSKDNYESATYTSIISTSTTMVKIENNVGLEAGERLVLVFEYEVDEDQTSIENAPEKLGAINDFMPHYYFDAGSSAWLSGTKVGAVLEIGEISGMVFLDKDRDGIYTVGTDEPIAGKEIMLSKFNQTTNSYLYVSSETSLADGTYKFSDIGNGVYKIDFNELTSVKPYFTLKDRGSDESLDSDVNNVDTNIGIVDKSDPTKKSSLMISAGILDYVPNIDLSLSMANKNITVKKYNGQNVSNTDKVEPLTITPDYYDEVIKPVIDGVTTTVNDGSIATVDATTSIVSIRGTKVGTTTAKIIVRDIFGNEMFEDITVTVSSNDVPVVTQVVNLVEVGSSTYDPKKLITAIDTEDGILAAANITVTESDFDITTLGTYSVKYTATDSDSNETEFSITVKVTDTVPPIITVVNETVTIEIGSSISEADFLVLVGEGTTDNSNGTIKVTTTFSSVKQNVRGETDVTITAMDESGNKSTQVIAVKVTDTVPPIITVVNETVTIEIGSSISEADFLVLVGEGTTDNSNGAIKVTTTFSSVKQNVRGETEVIITAMDESGNKSTQVIAVKVTDTVPPIITVVNETVTIEIGSSISEADFLALVEVGTTDNSDGAIKVTTTFSSVKQNVRGETDVTITAMDESGNKSTQVIAVKVTDTVPPIITVVNETVTIEIGSSISEAEFLALVGEGTTDNSNGVIIVTTTFSSVKQNVRGETDVTITAMDESGNVTTKTVTVKVTDTAPSDLGSGTVKTGESFVVYTFVIIALFSVMLILISCKRKEELEG